MFNFLSQNIANLIVGFRIMLIFVVLIFLSVDSFVFRFIALNILLFAIFLDGFDGYIARKFDIESKVGGLLDTLGDRITENCLIIYFSYMSLIPFWVAIFFVVRSMFADFIRSLNFYKGIGTFSVNTSTLGKMFVSSVASRVLYLILKMILFVGASIILMYQSSFAPKVFFNLELLKDIIYKGAVLIAFINALRFALLTADSKEILKENFMYEKD
ncbi:MAG: CDP-alcohol phosphatidyltransferase family protein [Elusimicrobiota bacterium]